MPKSAPGSANASTAAKVRSRSSCLKVACPSLDSPGQPFFDKEADAALFAALEQTVRQTRLRRLERVPHAINDPAFAAAVLHHFHAAVAEA